MKNHMKTILFYLVVILAIVAVVSVIFQGTKEEKTVLADVVTFFEKDQVISFVIDDSYNLTMEIIKSQNADGSFETEERSYRLQSLALFQQRS